MMTPWVEQHDFEAMLATMPIAVVVLDNQGEVVWLNQKAKSTCPSIQGQLWRDCVTTLFTPHPSAPNVFLLPNKSAVRLETVALTKGGQVLYIYDVQEQDVLHHQLNQQKRLQALGNMCANLAHQIRNPLCAALLHNQSLIKRYPEEPKLQKLRKNLDAIDKEINAILMFSKSDKTLVEPLDMVQLVEQAIEVANRDNQPVALEFVNLSFESTQILGNDQALIGAFTNIIHNAIEASEASQRVKITLKEQSAHLELLVQDSGAGIDSAMLAQIQEPFFTTKTQGTGLGVSIAKTILENHQGHLSIVSQPGKGTSVCMTLPKDKR